MKKLLYIFLTLSLLLTFDGCKPAEPPAEPSVSPAETPAPVSFDEEALNEDAILVASELMSGDFDRVHARFSPELASELDASELGSVWAATVEVLGSHLEHISCTGEVRDGYYIAVCRELYDGGGLDIQVTYTSEGSIAGVYLSYSDSDIPDKSASFVTEDIILAAEAETPLGGTLTLPANVENPPIVILVQGSGALDRNETIYTNKPFKDIAEGLAELGVASLRYDKRYYSYPDRAEQLGAAITLRDEVLDDLDAAITLLRTDERFSESRIYVLGHSLGGMLMPFIAVEHPNLSGVISMAGSLRELWEISYDQVQAALGELAPSSSLSDEDRALLKAQTEQAEQDISILRGDLSEIPEDRLLLGMYTSYWRSAAELCGMNYIDRVEIPMLILQGSADFQVSAEKDYPLWQEKLSGRDNVEFHLYEGLNHLMMPTQGKSDISEYQTPEHVSPEVVADIAEFIISTAE